jgi:hypothetical protein
VLQAFAKAAAVACRQWSTALQLKRRRWAVGQSGKVNNSSLALPVYAERGMRMGERWRYGGSQRFRMATILKMLWAVCTFTSLRVCIEFQVDATGAAFAGTSTMFRHLPVFSCKGWKRPKRKLKKPPTCTFSNGSSGLGSGKPL